MFNLQDILLGVPTTLLALTVHEYAHGWVSDKLGDPTPRMEGRLTLNPLYHLDLYGTILMIITGFGWARPVRVNARYYKDVKKGMALTAAAGPIANFLLAIVGLFIGFLISFLMAKLGAGENAIYMVTNIAYFFAVRNLCFMVFNLIPFPPLDGFKVAGLFIPGKYYYQILRYEHYIMYALMFLALIGAFDFIISGGVYFFLDIIVSALSKLFGIFM